MSVAVKAAAQGTTETAATPATPAAAPAAAAPAATETPPVAAGSPASPPATPAATATPPASPDPKASNNPPPAAPVVPETYDLKVPDGSPMTPAQVEALSVYAKENKLTQDQAQGLLDREHAAVNTYAEAQKEQFTQRTTQWLEQMKSDKEIGGDLFDENVERSKRVLTKFAPPEFSKMLNESGLGNHPDLMRMLVRIEKATADDSLINPREKVPAGGKSLEDIFYPTEKKET